MSEQVLGLSSVSEIKHAESSSMHDVIGMVVDVLQATKATRGDGDWMSSIYIVDESCLASGDRAGVRCKFFRRNEADTLKAEIGDVVCIKNIKANVFQGMAGLVSTKATESIVFARDGIPDKSYSATYEGGKTSMTFSTYPVSDNKPTIAEQMHVIELVDKVRPHFDYLTPTGRAPIEPASKAAKQKANVGQAAKSAGKNSVPPPIAAAPKIIPPITRKFRLLRNVADYDFADLVVEVIKIFPSHYGDYVELYVTDYTSNRGFFDYADPLEKGNAQDGRDGDEYGYIPSNHGRTRDWPGPWGQMTLKIEVQPPHMEYVRRHVTEGSQIMMSNVRIKVSRGNHLEGNLFPDMRYRDKICISSLRSGNLERQELQDRKDKYWESRKQRQGSGPGSEGVTGKPKKLTKGQKKAKRREAEEKAAKEAADKAEAESRANQNVQCSIDDVAISTIRDMLAFRGKTKDDNELPFVNQKRRLKVQTVDFFPPDLKDFSQLISNTTDDDGSDVEMVDATTNLQWQWSFFLLLQDVVPGANAACWVHVADEAAEKLLSQRAADLRSDNMSLHKLREQLFKLWGNLEEIKEQIEAMSAGSQAIGDEAGRERWGGQLSNRPFECCIHEYGQRLAETDRDHDGPEWIRLHSLTDTTIK